MQETSFALANNQIVAANVTGLSFNSASYKSAHIYTEVRRKTDSNEAVSNGILRVMYKDSSSAWILIDELGGDDDGITFSITTGGQIQYTSNDLLGTNYSGKVTFKAITFSA
jgi:hypothetical protein